MQLKVPFKNFSTKSKNVLIHFPLAAILTKGWQFATKGYANNTSSYRRKQLWKITYYALLNPSFSCKWFEFLESPRFNFIFFHRPNLYIKPFRVYISTKWDRKQRLKAILDTYKFLKEKEGAIEAILSNKKGILLADIKFDNYSAFLKLGYDNRFRKEGELVVSLECTALGGKIAAAAFSLMETKKNHWTCIIGCVQGNNYTLGNNLSPFKTMQKLLHGLRPNSLVIYALQELSRQMGSSSIHATGNSIQAHRKKHAIHLPWTHGIHFNYDKFWGEVGGEKISKDWFELPLTPTFKNIQEIKSNKRSMYRKRYQMLKNISSQITHSIGQLKQ